MQYLAETEYSTTVKTKGYSGSMGCLGWFLFGPLGLLCGNCGSGKSTANVNTETSHSWVCRNCGKKFRPIEDIEKEIVTLSREARARSVRGSVIMCLCLMALFYILMFIFLFILDKSFDSFYDSIEGKIFTYFPAIACPIGSIVSYLIGLTQKERVKILVHERDELESKMARFNKQ